MARKMGWWWSDEHELAALDVEVGHANFVATLAAAGVKKGDLPKPLELPRPIPAGEEEPQPVKKPGLSREAMRAVLSGGR